MIFFLLLASCSNDETLQPSGIDWTPDVSRSVTGGQELRIVGRQDGIPLFDKILIPAEAGGKASWKDGKPVWGNDCTHCMACICKCPTEAIEYGKVSIGQNRYVCKADAEE